MITSSTVLGAIATFRNANNGLVPSAMIIDTASETIQCLTINNVFASEQPNVKLCIAVNYQNNINYYSADIPIVVDTNTITSIKDYMFMLMEIETRP